MGSDDTTSQGSIAGATSPWFARIAEDLLKSGNTKEALRVCLEGARAFPRYATGRLMLGKCYEVLGSHVQAMLEYRRVIEVFPDNHVVRELVRNAEKREQEGFNAFAAEWQTRWQGRKDRLTFEEYVGTSTRAGDTSVGRIMKQLDDAPHHIPIPTAGAPVAETPREAAERAGRFVTATLAEIYASQGEYNEAIEAYRTLAEQRPGSAERYQKRLVELEELKRRQTGHAGM